jgi:pimeloyl-ACP methyl ester carboxylesterase
MLINNQLDNEKELVVLLHGFGAKRVLMWPLARRLRADGFRVVQWNFLSLFSSIEKHAKRLHDFLTTQLVSEKRVHIVAHSMGSIVTRAALNRLRPPNLGRVVLLAPPNRGSPAAGLASLFVGAIITPSRELSDRSTSYVNQLKTSSDIEIGIIAAKYDLLVPAKNTHLPSEREHVTLIATHNSLLLSRSVGKMTANFLRTGEFQGPESG